MLGTGKEHTRSVEELKQPKHKLRKSSANLHLVDKNNTYRQQRMTPHLVRQRHDGRKIANQIPPRRKAGQINHAGRHRHKKHVHVFEVADDAVEADAEAGFRQLFGRGGPFDADAEEVAEDGFEEVEGDAAEEEEEESVEKSGS